MFKLDKENKNILKKIALGKNKKVKISDSKINEMLKDNERLILEEQKNIKLKCC